MIRQISFTHLCAWGVHLYTGIGGIIGMFALYAAASGKIRNAFILLVISMLIDATDGLLARRYEVKKILPDFDGAMVDNVIDMLTFVWIPVFIIWQESLLPHVIWTIPPMIAGLYAYGQVNMKSDDDYFIGFPCYWNIVVLYMYWLRPDAWLAILTVIIPTLLTFIPTRYLYPSKNQIFWRVTWGLGAIWFVMVFVILTDETVNRPLVLVSLFYPVYYLVMSFYIDFRIRFGESYDTQTAENVR
jgi:phosphatidylcholine synthase